MKAIILAALMALTTAAAQAEVIVTLDFDSDQVFRGPTTNIALNHLEDSDHGISFTIHLGSDKFKNFEILPEALKLAGYSRVEVAQLLATYGTVGNTDLLYLNVDTIGDKKGVIYLKQIKTLRIEKDTFSPKVIQCQALKP